MYRVGVAPVFLFLMYMVPAFAQNVSGEPEPSTRNYPQTPLDIAQVDFAPGETQNDTPQQEPRPIEEAETEDPNFAPQASDETQGVSLEPEAIQESPRELSRRSRATQQTIFHASYEELFLMLDELELSTHGSKYEMQTRLYEYYELDPLTQPERQNSSIEVIIDAAENVSVFRIEEDTDDYIRLSGGVVLTLVDNKTNQRHTIFADSLLLNKDTRYMTATGSIRYELHRQETDTPEIFSGDSITINIDSWEGVFIDGISETDQVIESVRVKTVFSGDTIVRSSRNSVAFSDVNITTGEEISESYFSVRVKKLWLLASGEWAVLNPIVHVGNVPLLWFPFYFQPGDRLFFRPVLGIHSEFGPYIHTSTYIFGKPKSESGADFSLLQIDSGSEEEREIDGLFLRPKGQVDNENSTENRRIFEIAAERNWLLKLYLDGYARRGIFLGIEADFRNLASLSSATSDFVYASLNSLTVNNYYGFTRTLFSPSSNVYTNTIPYQGQLRDHWDSGSILNLPIPFRTMIDLTANITLFNLHFDTKFELYSDTTIGEAFRDHEEVFSWDFALGRHKSLSSVSSKTRSEWSIKTSYDFSDLPFSGNAATVWDTVNKIISIDLSNFEFLFEQGVKNKKSSDIPGILGAASIVQGVSQQFFVPLQLSTELQGRVSGTLFSYPLPSYYTSRDSPVLSQLYETPLTDDELLQTPWDDTTPNDATQAEDTQRYPPLQNRPYNRPQFEPFTFDLSYTLDPQFLLSAVANTDEWERAEEIDLENFFRYQSYTASTTINLLYSMTALSSLLTHRGSITARIADNMLLAHDSKYVSPSEQESISTDLFKKNEKKLEYNFSSTLYPLQQFSSIGSSSIEHSLKMLLYDEELDSVIEKDAVFHPVMMTRNFAWDEEFVTTHSLQANFAVDLWGLNQVYSLGVSLPPLESVDLSPAISLSTDLLSLSASIRIKDLTNVIGYDPLDLSLSTQFSFLDSAYDISASQSFKLVVDDPSNSLDYSASRLSLKLFNGIVSFDNSLYVRNTYKENYSQQLNSWEKEPSKTTILESSTHALKLEYTTSPFWKNRIQMTAELDSELSMNYNRFTDSLFTFALDFSFSLFQALDVSLAMNVRNSALHTYNKGYADLLGIESQDFFADLGDSLNIFDQASLQRGDFKIQSISLNVERSYRDWKLAFSYTGSPKIVTENNIGSYKWDSVFTFAVTWNLISQFQTKGSYEDDIFNLVY